MFTVLHEFGLRFKNQDGSWKYRGYDLMQRIERWAKRYPDRVHLAETDDSHHMSSFLCIIECATKDKWMGLTVYSIPQNGVELDEFFLYPCDHTPLVKLLKELERKARRTKQREWANERKFWRAMHAACPKPRS